MFRKAILGLASASLLLGSTAAIAAPGAAPAARDASPLGTAEQSGFAGVGSLGWLIALLIATGVIVIIASDSSEDEDPFSP